MKEVSCEAATSADEEALEKLRFRDPLLSRIDEVARDTLRECMQDVFEDGPKRDRRLWLGDLRLQALAGYATFRNNDLVKRCLYLFAGTALPDGALPACLFTEPEVEGDDQYMFDYSLLFAKALQAYSSAGHRARSPWQARSGLSSAALRRIRRSLRGQYLRARLRSFHRISCTMSLRR